MAKGSVREQKRSEVLQGTLDLMILKTLDAMGPLHGYGIARRIFNVPGDTNLYVPLPRNTGDVVLTSVPNGADILVDGQQAGRTPLTLHLSLGTHRITWVQGQSQHEETIEVQSGIQARGYRFQ